MPKAFRQRGKKKKNVSVEDSAAEQQHEEQWAEGQTAGPSWIVSAPEESLNSEAPFGYVDAEVKAYFRTVDAQLRDWQGNDENAEVDENVDPNENRRMFLMAALQEMAGKERELATDPDCSTVLERMVYSMDDFVRRVFMDALSGSYEQLVKHRFASHVVQTLIGASADALARESRGIYPSVGNVEDKGELRTATQLVVDICEELLPSMTELVLDPFASHVVRALLAVLCPNLFASDTSIVRSKKSAAWKAKQGEFKSVFTDEKEKGKASSSHALPAVFADAASRIIIAMRDGMDANEVRSLAANKASCPVLQMAIQVEADMGMADEPDSLMDRVLVGLITLHRRDPSQVPEESDYLGTLLRDTTSSHLLEALVLSCPADIFPLLWSIYFQDKLGKLAVHPVANFVVAKAIERVSPTQLEAAVEEMSESWKKIRTNRPGVLRALLERAATIRACERVVSEAVCTAFELGTPDERYLAVPCVLRLQTPKEHRRALVESTSKATGSGLDAGTSKKRHRTVAGEDPLEPKVAGALLLQSLLKLSEPYNRLVLDSLQSMPIDDVIALAHHATSSRVLDVLLDSPTVVPKQKRVFVQSLLGHYHRLVDNRIGSRVGDRCWATADTFLKEKIARSLLSHETALAASFYGKFFARRLNLYLLQRRPDEWRNLQGTKAPVAGAKTLSSESALWPSETAPSKAAAFTPLDTPVAPPRKRKRTRDGQGNEIDALFDDALGRKVKRAALATDGVKEGSVKEKCTEETKEKVGKKWKKEKDNELGDVLSAIRAAPKGERRGKKDKV